jgi:hypothetical protein
MGHRRPASVPGRACRSPVTRRRFGSRQEGMEMAKRKAAAKRELINTDTDKRFVRCGAKGRFNESDDVGKSLTVDRRQKAKTKVKSGQGDKGDRSRR